MNRLKAASQRQDNLDAYKTSGETVSQWCEHNGIHRTTLYRWLRLDAKHSDVKAAVAKKEPKTPIIEPVQIKWLPVTMSNKSEQTVSAVSKVDQRNARADAPANAEIRVQIGGFTVITPDGFKRETLESVCQTLQAIC